MSDFQNNVNNVRTRLLQAIASAANVSIASVNITGFAPHALPSGRRRLLTVHTHMGMHYDHHRPSHHTIARGVQMLTPSRKRGAVSSRQLLDVFSDVHGSKHISNLNHHLAAQRVPLHAWRELHGRLS